MKKEKKVVGGSEVDKALNTIRKADLQELKAFRAPPQMVADVMDCILIALGEKIGWEHAQKQMADPMGYIERIRNVDPSTLSKAQIKAFLKRSPPLTFDEVKKRSCAAASLTVWIKAVESELQSTFGFETIPDSEPSPQKSAHATISEAEPSPKKQSPAKKEKKVVGGSEVEKALNTIRKSDLQELKALRAPPQMVADVMDCIQVSLGGKMGWEHAQKQMADPMGFVNSIRNVDPTALSKAQVKAFLKRSPPLTYDEVRKRSSAAASLTVWIKALEHELQ